MARSLRATQQALDDIIDPARIKKNWKMVDEQWAKMADVSLKTVQRFWDRELIRRPNFIAICQAIDINNWQEIADLTPPPAPSIYSKKTWVGRNFLIDDLLTRLNDQTRIVWLTGISGVGKTTLAECLAMKAWNKNNSFVWNCLKILDGESPDFAVGALELLAQLGDIDIDPKESNHPELLSDRLFRKLQTHPYWIQLDSLERLLNPEQPNEFTDIHWFNFLQCCLKSPNFLSRLILTSQALPMKLATFKDDYSNRWYEMTLRGLEVTEQYSERLELFRKAGISVDESNTSLLSRIGQIYEGHPLVLQVIAKEILATPFNGNIIEYWERYSDEFEQVAREIESQRVNPILYNQELQKRVREKIKKSLEHLPIGALNLLCRASVYRRPVPETFWLRMIEERTPQQQQEAYQILGDRVLVEQEGIQQQYFLVRQHNLIRSVAYDLLKADIPAWENAEQKAADLWLTIYEPASNVPKLETIRGCLEGFYHLYQARDWIRISDEIRHRLQELDQLQSWGYYQEILMLYHMMLSAPKSFESTIYTIRLGNAYYFLGEHSEAFEYWKKGLSLAREFKDSYWEGRALGNLSVSYFHQAKYDKAIEFNDQYLHLSRSINDLMGEAHAHGGLGASYHMLTQYDSAIDHYQQELQIRQEIGDLQWKVTALNNLGDAYNKLLEYDQAINYFVDSIEIAHNSNNPYGEMVALTNSSVAYRKLGNFQTALQNCQRGLDLARKYGNLYQEGRSLLEMGNNLIHSSELNEAKKAPNNVEKALSIFRNIGCPDDEAESLKDLADLYLVLGDCETAQQLCQQASVLAMKLGIPLALECEALKLKIEGQASKNKEKD